MSQKLKRSLASLVLALVCHVSQANPIDPAAIPDEVLQKLPGLQPSAMHPLLQELSRHHAELDSTVRSDPEASAGKVRARTTLRPLPEGKALPDGRRLALQAKAHELTVLSQTLTRDKTLPSDLREGLVSRIGDLKNRMKTLLDSRDERERTQAATQLQELLDRLAPKSEGDDGAFTPGQVPGFTRELAKPIPSAPKAAVRPAYLSQKSTSTVLLAMNGTLAQIAALLPPTPEPTQCDWQSADLAGDGRNIQLTPEIRALAAELAYSPARIADWVRTEIRFEPYFFAAKGSQGTLIARAGGTVDIASLTIALLRASNIPARYVLGDIAVIDDSHLGADARIAKWLGVKTYAAAKSALTQGQFPNVAFYPADATADSATGIRFNHVWAEACVPYAHYRGNRMDNAGQRWVPLDLSYRQPDYQPGISTAGIDLDYATYLAKRSSELPDERFERLVAENMRNQSTPRTIDEVGYTGRESPVRFDILPTTLPYDVLDYLSWPGSSSAEAAVLPDAVQLRLSIEFRNGANALLAAAYETYVPAIALKRVTLGFEGATASAQTALNNWRLDGNSSSVLPCPQQTVPNLKVEGISQGLSNLVAVDLCSKDNTVNLAIYATWFQALPGNLITQAPFAKKIKAANLHALAVNAFQHSEQLLVERGKKLLATVRATANPNSDPDGIDGEFLHLVGLKYLHHIDRMSHRIGELTGQSGQTGHSLGLISTQTKVQQVFDMPFGISRTGYLVDVVGIDRAVDISSGNFDFKEMKILAYGGSAYESYVWQENARTDAVSTMRGLQYAKESGIEILALNKSNWPGEKTKLTSNTDTSLNYAAGEVAGIEAEFLCATCQDGYVLTLPRSKFVYGDGAETWKGYVLAAELNQGNDKQRIVMAISGGYNGGYSISRPISWFYNPVINTGFSYFTPPPVPSYTNWSQPVYAPPATITPAIGLGVTPYASFAGDPVNLVNGNVYHNERDLTIKGRGGLDFVFERAYNSRETKDGPLGFGWTHSLNHYLLFASDNPDGAAGADDTDTTVSSIVWVDGTGSRKAIASNGTATSFTTPKGFFFTVSRQSDSNFLIQENSGFKYVFENKTASVPANDAAALSNRARLVRVEDRNGNALTLSYVATTGCSGAQVCKVTDALNRSLNFTYNAAGRLDSIADWTGRQWKYAYDGAGNLASYKNPRAAVGKQNGVAYAYYSAADGANLDHALKSYTLPRGNGMTFEYYINGRAFRHYNSLHPEKTTSFAYNDFRRETVVTDERGNSRQHFFDRYGNPEKIEEPDGGIRSYAYDCRSTSDCPNPYNRLSETDPTGLTIEYTYDAAGNQVKTYFPAAATQVQRFDFAANTFGQPRRIQNVRNNWTVLRYDAKGNVTDEIRLKSGASAAACTSAECAVPGAASIAAWTQRQYDAYGNVTQVKRIRDFATQAGPTLASDWNDAANNVVGLNPVRLTRTGDKTGDGAADAPDVATQTFDALSRMTSGVDAAWYPVAINEYDEVDRPVRSSDAMGRVTEIDRDANGNVTEHRTVVGGQVAWRMRTEYNDDDQAITTYDNAGNATQVTYDGANNRSSTTNPDGYTVNAGYDALNRLTAAFDAEGNLTQRDYDIGGRVQSITNALGVTRSYTYYGASKSGRLQRASLPAIQGAATGRATEYDYDAAGNVIRESAIGSDGSLRSHLSFYDELERPVRQVSPAVDGARRQVCRQYSALGDLTSLWIGPTVDTTSATCNFSDTNLKKQATTTYDDFGRKLTETDPLAKVWAWTWDIHGKPLTQKDGKNQTTTFTWKADGSPDTRRDHANRLTTWSLDGLGRVLSVVDPQTTTTFVYDPAGRVATVTDSRGAKTLTYAWSAGGLLNRLTDGEGRRTDYLYDGVGRQIGQWLPNGEFAGWAYDSDGKVALQWGDGSTRRNFTWNADGSLAQLDNLHDGAIATQHLYTYSPHGQRASHEELIVGARNRWRQVYDDMGRLREVWQTPLAPTASAEALYRSYRYDAFGNRLREYFASGQFNYYGHDAAQQLKQIDRYSATATYLGTVAVFGYDDNGSLALKQGGGATTSLGWDESNRLKSARQVATSTGTVFTDQSYSYDAFGRRIARTVGGVTTQVLYDGADPQAEAYAEYDTWPQPKAIYADGPGVDDPLAKLPLSNGTLQAARYYHADAQGTIDAVSQSGLTGTAAIVGWVRQDIWGGTQAYGLAEAPVTGPAYQGRERDATGLSWHRARYYDAAAGGVSVGRFISRDPLGFAGGLNPYAAFENDPGNLTDPTGTTAMARGIQGLVTQSYVDSVTDILGLGKMTSGSQSLATVTYRPSPYQSSTTASVQTALAVASAVPVIGSVASLASAYLDADEGHYGQAAISLATAIPFMGSMRAVGRMSDILLDAARVEGAAAGAAERLVIGRGADLARPGALNPGEFKLGWPPTGATQSEWKVNSGLLRQEMNNMRPIRDASVGNNLGIYLNAERSLLTDRGWKLDKSTSLWMPVSP